jgi:DASS family divalent anion:Na+ symporter
MVALSKEINVCKLGGIVVGAFALWVLTPMPSGLTPQAWHMLILFVATMLGIIIEAMPMIGVLFLSLLVASVTGTVNLKTHGFVGFSNIVPWVLFFVISLAKTITDSTIGPRIAYFFMKIFGRNALGLAYSISISEFVLSLILPSNTARSACLGYPIVNSLSKYMGETLGKKYEVAIGGFLGFTYACATSICSAMFLTGMVSNALILDNADKYGFHITWMDWLGYAFVPGLILLIICPIILRFLMPTGKVDLEAVRKEAVVKSKELGSLSSTERKVLIVFGIMLVMWVMADVIGVSVLTTSVLGLCVFVFLDVLKINNILGDHLTIKTFMMMGILISYSNCLFEYGVIEWFNNGMAPFIESFSASSRLYILAIMYYLGHYFFSGEGSYISAINIPFIVAGLSLGIDKPVLIMTLAVLSSYSAVLSPYAGPAMILIHGLGYISTSRWMFLGLVISVVLVFVWFASVHLGLVNLSL